VITKARYCQIKRGDVVLWNGRPRYVMEGPGDNNAKPTDHSSLLYVRFPIRRRSWTSRAHTLYGWNDAKHALTIPRRKLSASAICSAEKSHLAAIGFDWLAELRREVEEGEALAVRMKRIGYESKPNRAFRIARAQLRRNTK